MGFLSNIHFVNQRMEAWLTSNLSSQVLMLLYICANTLVFLWGAVHEYRFSKSTSRYSLHQNVANAAARGGGFTITLNAALILFCCSRRAVTSLRETILLRFVPSNKTLPVLHRLIGYSIGIGVVVHAPFPLARVCTHSEWDGYELWGTSLTVYNGIGILILCIIIVISSMEWVRKRCYHLFYIIHILCGFLLFIGLIFHGVHRRHPQTYKFVLPGLMVYVVDRIWRHVATFRVDLDLSDFSLLAGKIMEVRIPKKFEYKAGQYAEIQVPMLGFEWHPFSIASAPTEDKILFYIKAHGDWTSKLYKCFQERTNDSTIPNLDVKIRGPYGAPSDKYSRFKKLVLIAGGIGATPLAAITKHISLQKEMRAQNISEQNQESQDKNTTSQQSIVDSGSPDHTIIDFGTDIGDVPHVHVQPDGYSRLWDLLHSSRMAYIHIFVTIMRLALVAAISIFHLGTFHLFTATIIPSAYWALCVEALVALVFLTTMGSTIFLDVCFTGRKYFCSPIACIHFFVFIHGSILSTMMSIVSCLDPTYVIGTFSIVHFGLYLPALFILLVYRMKQSNEGNYGNEFYREEEIPKVHFIWTVRKSSEDQWLRERLGGAVMNLRRYVTGEGETVETEEGIHSCSGRPDWKELFKRIANTTTCAQTVGVFFCGPYAMGVAVRRAVREVEVLSHHRSSFSTTNNNDGIVCESKVRFQFFEENF